MQKVLIESDWNLKLRLAPLRLAKLRVLIESDWNLKRDTLEVSAIVLTCINRIRLEFKDMKINIIKQTGTHVLIESDWNLKQATWRPTAEIRSRINRIRLEFKGKREQSVRHGVQRY